MCRSSGVNMPEKLKHIKINNLPIRFGQFLKFADLVQDGIEAKLRIQAGEVLVNGLIETRRGRKLEKNDTVTLNGITYQVT